MLLKISRDKEFKFLNLDNVEVVKVRGDGAVVVQFISGKSVVFSEEETKGVVQDVLSQCEKEFSLQDVGLD